MRYVFMFLFLVALVTSDARAQNQQTDWNKPFPPHKVIGNVYYVGSEQLASFLITTPAGHILINSSFETTVPVIRAAVENWASSSRTSRSCSAAMRTAITWKATRSSSS